MQERMDRRRFMRLSGAIGGSLLAGGVLAACADEDKTASSSASAGSQAPAQRVAGPDDLALTPEELEQIRSRGLRFGFNTNNRTDDFSATLIRGGEETAEEYGIELIVGSADFDASKQLSDVQSLVQQQVDAIFLVAVDANAISPAVLAANRANIPIVIVGGPPTRGEVVSVMNSSSYRGCFDSATALTEAIGRRGEVGIVAIPLALETIKQRDRGARDALRRAGVREAAFQAVSEQDEALSATQNIIQANPDVTGIFATWSLAVNGALAAIEDSGRDIKLSGFDAERAGFRAFDRGNEALVSLSGQQAFLQGRVGIDALCKTVLEQRVARAIEVPTVLVTRDNYREMWDRLYPGVEAPFRAA